MWRGSVTNRLHELALLVNDAQTLAAAAGRRLHHHRIADVGGDFLGVFGVLDLADIAGNGADLRGHGELLGLDLIAHSSDGLDVRADKGDADLRERFRERLPFRQEAITRMHGLRARVAAGLHDAVDDEIGLCRGRRSNMDGLIGHLDVQSVLVGIGIDGNRLDAHLAGRLYDAAGDLAAIGNQYLLEQCLPRPAIDWPDETRF